VDVDREKILIEKARSGHEDSFAELIDLYKNYIFAIILNFIKDYNEVENMPKKYACKSISPSPAITSKILRVGLVG